MADQPHPMDEYGRTIFRTRCPRCHAATGKFCQWGGTGVGSRDDYLFHNERITASGTAAAIRRTTTMRRGDGSPWTASMVMESWMRSYRERRPFEPGA